MTQIENGMIVGAEKYDPQCQDIKMQRCTVCREMWPQGDLTYYAGTGDWVCPDCRMQYLREQGADFVESYIDAHQMEYYAGWWWTSQSAEEQLKVIKMAYLSSITDPVEIEPLARDRVEFCQDAEDFLEFVEEKLL